MPETIIDKQHTKITLGLVVAAIAAAISGGIAYGNITTRLGQVESQTKTQWQKLSKIEANAIQLAIMDAKLETILKIVQDK